MFLLDNFASIGGNMETKKNNSVKWISISITVIAIGILIGAMTYIFTSVKAFDQIFTQGVSIQGIDVGGMTREEAYTLVDNELKGNLENQFIEITDEKQQYKINLSELGTKYQLEQVVEEAFRIGHEGNLFEKYQNSKSTLNPPKNFQVAYHYELSNVKEVLKGYASHFYVAPIDATIERKNRKFIITPEKSGKELNIDVTSQHIMSALEQEAFNQKVSVTLSEIKPVHTAEALKNVQTPISSFNTSYNNADQDRNTNLQVSAAKINELLAPGEVFELSSHLEPITAAAGYKPSKVIVNGRIEDGIGGGVCQIASTLYNAVLLSNLDITVRRNHSLPVAYVPLGRDATYATGGIDFKFQNNSEYPVFIESYCENNRVYVNIFSHPTLKPEYDEIKFQSEMIEIVDAPPTQYIDDPELPVGTEIQDLAPLQGKKVKLYKLCYKNGELVKKEVVNTSYYKPRAEIIKVGKKEVKKPVVEVVPVESLTADPLALEGTLDVDTLINDIEENAPQEEVQPAN